MLEEAELRELSGSEMQEARARALRDFAWTPIGAGQQLPFLALFEALPEEATSFEVRAAPSSTE
jgi:hypothetical protein